MAMAIPGPAGARIQQFAIAPNLLEAAAVDAPDVAVARRERAAVAQKFEPLPWKSDLRGPAAIGSVATIYHSVDMNGGTQTLIIPIKKAPSLAPRMDVAAH